MVEDYRSRLKTKTHKDYYQILRIRADSTADQIETAYCALYDKYGPNASLDSPDSEAMIRIFKDISDAYEVLSDPVKRNTYDRNLAATQKQTGDVRALWTKVTASFGPHDPNNDGAQQAQIQALSLEITTDITLKEAMKGAKRDFDISDPTPCHDCAGMKPVTRMQCGTCRGLGYFNVDRKEEIDLPPGLYDGMEIRKPDLGRFDMRAGKHGDLVIKVRVKEHPYLGIADKDITCLVPVTLYEAILGAEIEVPTATGKVMMKIQPLTQPGRVYRLKGLGLAGADQLVTIEVVLPNNLSGDEMLQFRKLKEMSRQPNPRDKRFPKQ